MASPLPPQLIHVKRKRHQEEQPTFLRVEDGAKRRQSGVWLYQRREPGAAKPRAMSTEAPAENTPPGRLQPSTSAGEAGPPEKIKAEPAVAAAAAPLPDDEHAAAVSEPPAVASAPSSREKPHRAGGEPRRFHLSRREADAPLGAVLRGGVSKRSRYASAVFVERSNQKRRAPPPAVVVLEPGTSGDGGMDVEKPAAGKQQQQQQQQPLKRPGVAARRPPPSNTGTGTGLAAREPPPLPTSFWKSGADDADMDRLAREMHAYTLEQIGYTLARQEDEKQREVAFAQARQRQQQQQQPPARLKPPQSRIRPKQPAQPRWAERNPLEAAALRQAEETARLAENAGGHGDSGTETRDDDDDDDESDDDDDYVMETYYRVPESALATVVPPEQIGLLVLDTEPDVEYFYGEGSGSEEEDCAEDDEDENAENHYSADYPDEELESDDEDARDAYGYRTGNASDLEEYDEAYD